MADGYIAGGSETTEKQAVLAFTKAVKEEYKQRAASSELLAIVNQQVEMLLSEPLPPPVCGPWFSGDGRGSNYLRPKYPRNGPTVIEVTDFFLGLNKTDPGP